MAGGTKAGEGGASAGVEALIDRLREQGTQRGQAEAELLLEEARAEADRILEGARSEAVRMLTDARAELEQHRASAEQALQLAVRDAVLALSNRLTELFSDQFRKLVCHELADRELLGKLILEVARRSTGQLAREGETEIEVLLPESAISLEQLRRAPQELSQSAIRDLVLGVAGEAMREGVTLVPGGHHAGIRVRLVGEDLELDLTDATLAAALLQHLRPRYRALLEGLIQG